jgi:hypothetical protein
MLLQFVNARAVNNDGALRQLTNAEYYCGYRRTVTQSVSIPNTPFTDVSKLRIWCRGTREAPGTSLDGELVAGTQPNYGYGYGEVVPESVTLNGGTLSFTLRTFIYELTGYLGGCSSLPDGVLWVPRRGGDVRMAFSALEKRESQMPSITESYYVPQAVVQGNVVEGQAAYKFFRACPNNDGGASLPLSARIKVVVRNAAGAPLVGVLPADIQVRLNGGTAAQGFLADGADSVVANGTINHSPLCPDVFALEADAPTDANGVTYITFTGASSTPGVGQRNPSRKWGHFDNELPVYVYGQKLQGRLTSAGVNGSYTLQIKNFDFTYTLGLSATPNAGEHVGTTDFNFVVAQMNGAPPSPLTYWADFDSNGVVNSIDWQMINNHITHDCDTPNEDQ